MQFGIVKWYSKTKGVGHIMPVIGGNEIRVFQADLLNCPYLLEGQRVQFTIEIQPKIFLARHVHLINSNF